MPYRRMEHDLTGSCGWTEATPCAEAVETDCLRRTKQAALVVVDE